MTSTEARMSSQNLHVSAIIFQLFKVIMPDKWALTILELNWNQRLGHKAKLNICYYVPSSSTELQKRSFHVIERTRTSLICQKMKNAFFCICKNTVFHCQIRKFVGFLLLLSSSLLKLPSLAPCEELIVFAYQIMETTVPFGRAISIQQLPFAILSDNAFWNRCISLNTHVHGWATNCR